MINGVIRRKYNFNFMFQNIEKSKYPFCLKFFFIYEFWICVYIFTETYLNLIRLDAYMQGLRFIVRDKDEWNASLSKELDMQ